MFSGVFPAVITPFTSSRQLAVDAFERLLDRLYSTGCDGIYVCGQTGEGLRKACHHSRRRFEHRGYGRVGKARRTRRRGSG
jgi:hypothetical protein